MMDEISLESYIERVEQAVRERDGVELNRLLRLKSREGRIGAVKFLLEGGALQTSRLSELGSEWLDLPHVIQSRFAASNALTGENFDEACVYMSQALTTYLNIVSKEDSWTIQLLHSMCCDVRILAEQADCQLRAEGRIANKMEQIERLLKRAFTVTNNDRREVHENSRRVGTLGIINQLLKVYFKLNNLRLCGNIIRAVDAPNFPDFESTFPIADRVTYKYFVGRLHLYEERIKEACECLTYSFDRTPDSAFLQKRMQLLYLVPAKLRMGLIPPEELLCKYKMDRYIDIVRACRKGDITLFNSAIQTHLQFFIGASVYLVLENLRPTVYRALIRLIAQQSGSSKIRIAHVTEALNATGLIITQSEVECILANLIYHNYVKGYIAHKLGYLVLSKKEAFPMMFE